MKKAMIVFLSAMTGMLSAQGQVKIGDNPQTISAGSLLELESTSRALTLPRMTTVQMQAIQSPVNGMIIFNLDSNCIYLYKTNNVWVSITTDGNGAAWPYRSNDNTVGTPGNKQGIVSIPGNGLIASGEYSHAEGLNSVASGTHSLSFGFADTASASGSMAIGYQNKTTGAYGFATGFQNIAAYQSSVALGQENKDSGWASMTMGLRNKISNAVSYSNAMGYLNQVNGGFSNNALGESNIIRSGAGNSLFGQSNIADGSNLAALGRDNSVFFQSAIALGQGNKDSGYASLAGGINNTIRSSVLYSNVFGYNNQVNAGSANAVIGENGIIKSGRSNLNVGYDNILDSANFSNALGTGNDIFKGNSHIAAGENNSIKTGNANSLLGQGNTADGSYLAAFGKDNSVFYQSAVALGQNNKDSGLASIAGGMGNTVKSLVQYATVFGYNNQLNGGSSNSILGENNIIKTGIGNAILGSGNNIEGNYSILGGTGNNSKTGLGNALFGQNNIADGYNLSAFGKDNIVFFQSSVALGQGNKDSGYASLAAGINNTIRSGVQYSNVIGLNNQVNGGFGNTGLGEGNIIQSGRGNVNAGYTNNILSANFSSAFGTSNDVLAGNSHFTGGENNTIKTGNANTLLGQNNTADGSYLGAIGYTNSVFAQAAVALGQGNKDSGYASIAGGLNNVIESNTQYNTAFGYNNLATKNLSLGANAGSATFTAGVNNINSGYGSIALGGSNRPTNLYGLAANYNTIANGHAQSAFGTFNDTIAALQGASFEPEEILFSIGNGFNNNNRRNSFTMLRNGFTTINATQQTGANTPRAELDVRGTGAIIVPVGTTAERPLTPVVGMIRFCTDCPGGPVLQGYDGTNWVNL